MIFKHCVDNSYFSIFHNLGNYHVMLNNRFLDRRQKTRAAFQLFNNSAVVHNELWHNKVAKEKSVLYSVILLLLFAFVSLVTKSLILVRNS